MLRGPSIRPPVVTIPPIRVTLEFGLIMRIVVLIKSVTYILEASMVMPTGMLNLAAPPTPSAEPVVVVPAITDLLVPVMVKRDTVCLVISATYIVVNVGSICICAAEETFAKFDARTVAVKGGAVVKVVRIELPVSRIYRMLPVGSIAHGTGIKYRIDEPVVPFVTLPRVRFDPAIMSKEPV